MKKQKITQVSRFYIPTLGGVEQVIKQISESLPETFEQEILVCSNNNKSEIINNVNITRNKYLFNFVANPVSPDFLWNLSRVNAENLHYHMPFMFSALAHFISKPKYKKLSITYHSDIVGYDQILWAFNGIYHKFLNEVEQIHVLSPNIIENSRILQKYKNKCVVIPYGIQSDSIKYDEQSVNEIKKTYKDKKILFSIGRLVKYKGFEYAIEAMKKINDDIVYLIAGAGILKDELQKHIDLNNLNHKVKLLGKISDKDLHAYYNACDIFVLPSALPSEAYGIVQIEAMSCSKPVINTNLGTGVSFVSIHNETGLTVEPKNSDQLAQAINTLLIDENLRLNLGKNARKRVEQYFDLQKLKNNYIAFFEQEIK